MSMRAKIAQRAFLTHYMVSYNTLGVYVAVSQRLASEATSQAHTLGQKRANSLEIARFEAARADKVALKKQSRRSPLLWA
jgi:hypothetical protein